MTMETTITRRGRKRRRRKRRRWAHPTKAPLMLG
jgi:hypothetical protein